MNHISNELVFVQSNYLFELEKDSHQHPTHDHLIDTTLGANSNEYEDVFLALLKIIIKH